MKRDFLKELGLEDEVIGKIMAEHGKTVNDIKEKADKVDSLQAQIDDFKGQIKDRDQQLKDLGEKAKGNEQLEQQIAKLQDENKQTAKDYQEKLDKQAFDFKLSEALSKAKAKNPKAVKALLDVDKIKLDGEQLLGLDDQLKNLRENEGYLFGDEPKLKGRSAQPSPSGDPKGMTKEQFSELGYSERVKLYNENPDLYKKLSN